MTRARPPVAPAPGPAGCPPRGPRATGRLLVATALAVLMTLGVAGCGLGDDGRASGAESASSDAPSAGGATTGDSTDSTTDSPAGSAASTGDSPAPAELATTPRGPVVEGTGYRLRLPRGWREVTARLSASSGIDRAAGSRSMVGGVRSTVNVVVDARALGPDQLAPVTRKIRKRVRATAPRYAVLPSVRVADTTAGHLAGLRSRVRDPHWLEQFVVPHGTATYIVTFAFPPGLAAPRRDRVVNGVLASWEWTD